MKTLYMIGGTMGVGKTTTCRHLRNILPNCVFLDGDWCWDMHPFQVTDETKAMVEDNICHLLNNFLRCSAYENIVFCWVMHQQEIVEKILSRLEGEFRLKHVSLICSPERLKERLQADVKNGIREEDVIARSVARLELYNGLSGAKLDVSNIDAEEAARQIAQM